MKLAASILVVTSLLCMGMGSCSSSVQETCQQEIPEMKKQLAEIRVQVDEIAASENRAQQGRAIASVPDPVADRNRVFELSPAQKDHLQSWAVDKLVRTESYQDVIRTHSELRSAMKPLSSLADELVKITGYTESGKVYQISSALQRAEVDADEASRAVCGSLSQAK